MIAKSSESLGIEEVRDWAGEPWEVAGDEFELGACGLDERAEIWSGG
jgi:hypothetical protein